jgi:hypothetical protein
MAVAASVLICATGCGTITAQGAADSPDNHGPITTQNSAAPATVQVVNTEPAPASYPTIEINTAAKHIGDQVTVNGTVGPRAADPSPTTHAFYFVAENGRSTIKVNTPFDYPKYGATYRLVGLIVADPPGNVYSLHEHPGSHIRSQGFDDQDRPFDAPITSHDF